MTDSIGYLDLAESLRAKGTFEADEHTEGIRTPGYPLFIAAVQGMVGPGIAPVVVVQVLLSVGVAALLYVLGLQVAGSSVGWAAAFLWALNPNSIFLPLMILSESLFAALLVGCLTLSVVALRRGSLWLHAASGALLGLAVLVRPIGIYLIPCWSVVLLIRNEHREGWRRGWRSPAAMAAAATCLVFAWTARNYAVTHEFYFSRVSGSTIRSFILGRALADARGISRSEAAPLISPTADMGAIAREILAQSPWSIPRVLAGGILRTALGTEAGTWLWLFGLPSANQGLLQSLLGGDLTKVREAVKGLFDSRETALYWGLMTWGVVYALVAWVAAVVGWVRSHGRLDWVGSTAHWLAALSTLYLVVVPLSNGDARFRMPVDPLLAFLAAVAWLRWEASDGVPAEDAGSPIGAVP